MATAREVALRNPKMSIAVLEKENHLGKGRGQSVSNKYSKGLYISTHTLSHVTCTYVCTYLI